MPFKFSMWHIKNMNISWHYTSFNGSLETLIKSRAPRFSDSWFANKKCPLYNGWIIGRQWLMSAIRSHLFIGICGTCAENVSTMTKPVPALEGDLFVDHWWKVKGVLKLWKNSILTLWPSMFFRLLLCNYLNLCIVIRVIYLSG